MKQYSKANAKGYKLNYCMHGIWYTKKQPVFIFYKQSFLLSFFSTHIYL